MYSTKVLEYLMSRPKFNTSDFIKTTVIARRTAYDILQKLKKANTIKLLEKGKGSVSSVYYYIDLGGILTI